MKFLNYYIKNPSAPRWTNWRDFVAQITGTPQHSVAILSLHFNHFENIKRLLDYLQKEKNQHFDIVLIENSTKVAERKKLSTDAKQFPNCTIITPVSNVGSAGGYALGMEYILSQPYSYFFVVEDDIILQQE
jgi:GT2 family glycosyltransferase